VTARNPGKRELYRERWKRVCHGKYLLVCPFFELSFNLLRPGGQLGFIVSNAFAKREFGRPLIEDFFPTIDLQKVVDCSGLMFPGHGTPTCVVFGRNQEPSPHSAIRVTAILPGGGDLRTSPEDSPLWHTIECNHDRPGFIDSRITVADRHRLTMGTWPWNLESSAEKTRGELQADHSLSDFIHSVGPSTLTRSDEVFRQPADVLRRFRIEASQIRTLLIGDSLRNWVESTSDNLIFPYHADYSRLQANEVPRTFAFLKLFKDYLENVIVFGKPKKETEHEWWEFTDPYPDKNTPPRFIAYAEITTHAHYVVNWTDRKFDRTVPVVRLGELPDRDHHLLAGLLNSSAALFWLKQVCFNKGAGSDEERDRFVYAGGKVQQLPIPNPVAESLRGGTGELAAALQSLSRSCWELGQQMPGLALRKLFANEGEAYYEWNSSLAGFVPPDPRLGKSFKTAQDLSSGVEKAVRTREQLRAQMIGLQEEMDWIAYVMYGLIPASSGVLPSLANLPATDISLLREERPFILWAQADKDLEKAIALIPSEWQGRRRLLWQKRLEAIRDHEHVRRIEQPVYKRRWDEQWKVGSRWQCGPIAYDAELVDAFSWWLSEKAEWWLEIKKAGGPTSLQEWTQAIASDARVAAAWEVVSDALTRLGRHSDFTKYFADLIKRQSVPNDIPFAVPWEELEKKRKIPAAVKRLRGKLNVPRERFRVTAAGEYIWAGKLQKK
ncbi:MAG TPA: hypothetical protein VMY18_10920, partial [Acidobacteriota bacterium]|nr:hypothetical protein [Acidobacteriota bacterium]